MCFVVVATLVLSAMQIVVKTEASPFALLFTNPDGSRCARPCILGVIPGNMSFERGLEILRAHPLMKNAHETAYRYLLGWSVRVFVQGNLSVTIIPEGDGMINAIRLGWSNVMNKSASSNLPGLTLGDLNAMLGSPKSLMPQHSCGYETAIFYDSSLQAKINFNAPIRADTPILDMQLSTHQTSEQGFDSKVKKWQGFATATQYGATRCEH